MPIIKYHDEYAPLFETFKEALAYCLADKFCKLYRAWEEHYYTINIDSKINIEKKVIVNENIFYFVNVQTEFGEIKAWLIFENGMEIEYSNTEDLLKEISTLELDLNIYE